ncbi:MAG: hypothetical protein KatS3mg031_2273 [Chitinophagales bacterium]|nr:MAG: hypothetical protein KatS3mg031_2273 [Chitinophagales bacterium]
MKTVSAILLSILWGVLQAQPQKSPADRKEQIEALRISYITQRLNLTREEAQRFWPVYNEYRSALDSLKSIRREQFKKYRDDFEGLSDKQIAEMVDNQIILRQKELDLMKKYHAEFKSLLPIKKVALLYKTEEEFKARLIREMHNRAD